MSFKHELSAILVEALEVTDKVALTDKDVPSLTVPKLIAFIRRTGKKSETLAALNSIKSRLEKENPRVSKKAAELVEALKKDSAWATLKQK